MLFDAILFAALAMVAGAIFTGVCWFTIVAVNALDKDQ